MVLVKKSAAEGNASRSPGYAPWDERPFAAHHSFEELEQLGPCLPRLRQAVHLSPPELQQRRALLRLPRVRAGAGGRGRGRGRGRGGGRGGRKD